MADLAILLTLQEHDLRLAQLHHRASHLPEDAEIAALQAKREALDASVRDARVALADLDRRQAELEQRIHDADAKIDAANKTLYSGTVTSPRELQSLEADIASLKRHRGEHEDAELELLLEREPLDAHVAEVDAAQAQIAAQQDELRVRAAAERDRLAAEAATTTAERSAMAASMDAAVLGVYEQVRAKNKGVGAARLEHGTCMACRLKLAAVDLDRIRALPADAVPRCEECGAILVR